MRQDSAIGSAYEYKSRARAAKLAACKAVTGLGHGVQGACCAACAAGKPCEGESVDVSSAHNTAEGVSGDLLLDLIKDGPKGMGDPGGAAVPDDAEAAAYNLTPPAPPASTPPAETSGNWFPATTLTSEQATWLLALLGSQPLAQIPFLGFAVPAGSTWQRASDGVTWWALLTMPGGSRSIFFYTFQFPRVVSLNGIPRGVDNATLVRLGLASDDGLARYGCTADEAEPGVGGSVERRGEGDTNEPGSGVGVVVVRREPPSYAHGQPVTGLFEQQTVLEGEATPQRVNHAAWASANMMRGIPAGLGDVPALQTALQGLQGGNQGDSASAFYAAKDVGDTYLGAGNAGHAKQYDLAVDTYKAAGQTAVGTTGVSGELASADPTGTVGTYTQQAWAINAQLNNAKINSTNSTGTAATQADAQSAQGYLVQMSNFYIKGAQAGIAANQVTPPAPPPPVPTPGEGGVTPVLTPPAPAPAVAASGTDYTTPILVGAVLVGSGLVGYAAYKRWYKSGVRNLTRASRAPTRVPSGSTARTVRA